MAIFNASSVDRYNIGDQKVRDYLYKLNEDLTYMFNNLTPDDNYSQSALNVLAKEGEKVAELSVSVDGIFANYLKGDSLIASIALDDSGVTIKADKITLEGLVTANGNFKILTDGSIEAKNGKFIGNISGSSIAGGEIEVGTFFADENGAYIGDFYVDVDDYSTLVSSDGYLQITAGGAKSTIMLGGGSSAVWIRPDGIDTPDLLARRLNGNAELYGGNWWSGYTIFQALDWLYDQIESLGE